MVSEGSGAAKYTQGKQTRYLHRIANRRFNGRMFNECKVVRGHVKKAQLPLITLHAALEDVACSELPYKHICIDGHQPQNNCAAHDAQLVNWAHVASHVAPDVTFSGKVVGHIDPTQVKLVAVRGRSTMQEYVLLLEQVTPAHLRLDGQTR
jgi:hypothetical protein